MGFMDELKKLTRPYDDGEDDLMEDVEVVTPPPAPEKPKPNPFSGFGADLGGGQSARPSPPPRSAPRQKEGRVVSIGAAGGGQMQVVLIKPERFEIAADIADHLRSNRPVLVNMETTPKDITRRLVDFLSGVTYAIDGNIQKVAASTYIMTPHNVDLVGSQLQELSAGGPYG